MDNLQTIINSMPDSKFELQKALKVLVDTQLLSKLARANANQLVDQRMDSDDEIALLKEIREQRQTNRILIGLEESARDIVKGIEDA